MASNSPAFVFTSKKRRPSSIVKDPVKSSTLSLGTPIAAASSSTFGTLRAQSQPKMLPSNGILHPKHHLAFVALAVGFLLVWTCIISGLLMSTSLTDKAMSDDAEVILHGHQDVGKVLYVLGSEMISTVDLLLSQDSNRGLIDYSKEALELTWQVTDLIFNQVMTNNHMKLATHLKYPYQRWIEFRDRSRSFKVDPRDAVDLYLLTSRDLENHYQKFTPSSIYYSPSNALKTPFVNSGVSYSLFNSGLYQRFGEIALGTCYVRSLAIINQTEYLDLQFGSRALIEAAFQFHPRAQQRYYELRSTSDADQIEEALSIVRKDILSGGRNRNNSKNAETYLEGVKTEISQLLLTKDYLNTTIYHQLRSVSNQNTRTFVLYLAVTIIALVAVLACLTLLCFSLRSLSLRAKYPPPRERIVYKANTFHQNHGQSTDLRTRSQTLPIETIYNPFNTGVSVDRPVTHATSQANQQNNQSSYTNRPNPLSLTAGLSHQSSNQMNIPSSHYHQKPSSPFLLFNNNDNKPRCFF